MKRCWYMPMYILAYCKVIYWRKRRWLGHVLKHDSLAYSMTLLKEKC